MPDISRAEKILIAVRAIDARGERPTSRSVLREIGSYHNVDNYGDNGMNGKDLVLFRDAMRAAGYRRVQTGQFGTRWKKGASDEEHARWTSAVRNRDADD